MADDASIQDHTEHLAESGELTPPGADADLPERLRVHSLARVLGTTSRKVLDALTELDGRTRSAHSSVDRTDAVRVRDVLAMSQNDPSHPGQLMLDIIQTVRGLGFVLKTQHNAWLHLAATAAVLAAGGMTGRRLDFLMQELNREANTLGSKSVSTETTQASVELKVLIEQMREQIQNVE